MMSNVGIIILIMHNFGPIDLTNKWRMKAKDTSAQLQRQYIISLETLTMDVCWMKTGEDFFNSKSGNFKGHLCCVGLLDTSIVGQNTMG